MFSWLDTHIYKIHPLALLTVHQQHKSQEVGQKGNIHTIVGPTPDSPAYQYLQRCLRANVHTEKQKHLWIFHGQAAREWGQFRALCLPESSRAWRSSGGNQKGTATKSLSASVKTSSLGKQDRINLINTCLNPLKLPGFLQKQGTLKIWSHFLPFSLVTIWLFWLYEVKNTFNKSTRKTWLEEVWCLMSSINKKVGAGCLGGRSAGEPAHTGEKWRGGEKTEQHAAFPWQPHRTYRELPK